LNALYASRHSGIDDKGISRCTSITHLDASNNSKITTCDPFASTLRVLEVSNVFGIHDCYSGIGDMGLKMCHNIKALHANYNPKITTCAPFANTLRILAASESSGISNNGLRLCNSLTRVTIYGNAKIDKTYIETRNKNILDIFQ